MEASTFIAFLETNWGWSAGLAGSMLALTVLASALLNPARKDEIALWLMGAQTEQSWSRSFVWLFDALFGNRHLSLRCFSRSALASLSAVALIWLLMGGFGDLKVRFQSELSLGAILVIALAVNVMADYISLLETRFLLGQMHRVRSFYAQAGVLLLDLMVSAAIIWVAIFAYLHSPLHQGEIESFAEIVGVFSVFSVIFYSTFLTSAWSWSYILSTWVMRLFRRLRLPDLLDVEHKPILVLGHVLAVVVFLVSLAVAFPMQRDAENLTVAERVLCSVFKGAVCLDVATLTEAEQAKVDLILLACEGGVTEECVRRGMAAFDVWPDEAARLLAAACEGGHAGACTSLGILHQTGRGGRYPSYRHMERLYRQGCEEGDARGCTNLGILYDEGFRGPAAAARLYRQGCEGGNALGCTNLGVLHEKGRGVKEDLAAAARLFRQGCEKGNARGCTNLGVLHSNGRGVKKDAVATAQLYRQGCEGGDALGCTNLGFLHETGLGVQKDPAAAARLYRQACRLGINSACNWASDLAPEQ